MLTDWWERLRGYDRWIEVAAVIEGPEPDAADPADTNGGAVATSDAIVWTDHFGNRQTAAFAVPDESPLYQKVNGDKVVIRYNPSHPERFYFRELYRARVRATIKGILIAAFLIVVVVMAIWIRA